MNHRIIFSASIFLGSFLLFQIQLVMGSILLTQLGGEPMVWNSCLLFFQTVLLAGYVYAHGVTNVRGRYQLVLHSALLVCSLYYLPLAVQAGWIPVDRSASPLGVMLLLGSSIGLPFLLLSASAPLLQYWHVQRFPGISPWPLYALSNGASLLALLSYPLLVEPWISLSVQCLAWGWGYGLYVILCGVSAVISRRENSGNAYVAPDSPVADPMPSTPWGIVIMWFLFALCGSVLLLAVTNDLTTSISAMTLAWMLPLTIYLLTFIACFANPKTYLRPVWFTVMVLSAMCRGMSWLLATPMIPLWQTIVDLVLLAGGCMVCHGELVALRPIRQRLTSYYLSITAGGALGTAFLTMIAPSLLKRSMGLPFALAVVSGALLVARFQFDGKKSSSTERL